MEDIMGFFRYIFLIAILTGSTSIGFLLSKGYLDRLNELKKLSNLINIFILSMHDELLAFAVLKSSPLDSL